MSVMSAEHDAWLLAAIVESSDDAIISKDVEGMVTSWNSAAEQIFGYSAAEILGQPITRLLPPDRLHEEDDLLRRLRHGQRIRAFETVRVKKCGTPFSVSLTISPIRNRAGQMIGASKIVREISERKEHEAALSKSEQQANLIADATPALISYIDTHLRYRFVNREYERWFGQSREQMLGRTMEEVLGEAAFARLQPYVEAVLVGQKVHFETEAPYLEGGTRWIEAQYIPHLGPNGVVIGFYVMVLDITRRKAAEEELRQSERRYRELAETVALDRNKLAAVIESMAQPVMIADSEGRFLSMNQASLSLHGVSSVEELKPGLGGLAERYEVRQADGRLLPVQEWPLARAARGEWITEELQVRDRTTGRRWIGVYTGGPVRNRAGEVVLIVLTMHDITERKRMEEALRESEHRLQATFDRAAVGIVEVDEQDRLVAVNDRFCQILDYSRAELLGRTVHELTAPEDRPRSNQLNTLLHQRAFDTFSYEKRYLRRDGSPIWVHVAVSAVRDAQGHSLRHIGTVEDITERKRAEQALRESESRYRTIAEAMPHLVWSTGPDGVLEYINRQWTEYTGRALAESAQGLWLKTVHPEDLERVSTLWQQALQSETEFNCDYRLRSRDGTYRWFKSWGVPLRGSSGQIINWFGACTDIDEAVKAREVLSHSRDELERTVQQRTARLQEMVAELETFSYSIAHDMRAPLRAMQGFAEAVLEDYGHQIASEGRDYLERIKNAAARQDHFIRDVLNYSSLVRQELVLEPTDLDAVIQNVIAEYPNLQQAKEYIDIHPPLGVVMGHAPSLVQCLSNLLGNAIKFLPPGARPQVRVWSARQSDRVRLWIEDNGIGIAPEHQARIFQLFERLHGQEVYPGTGIGLAVVRKATERMDGRVGVESNPMQGSRFWLELKCPGS